jgi:hypothetical protein
MAGFKSTYLSDKLNDHQRGGPDYTRPATLYYSLTKAIPLPSGSGMSEVSGSGYSRVAVTNNNTNFPASSGASKRCASIIDFGTFAFECGDVVGIAEFDSSVGGNFLSWGPLSATRTVHLGDSLSVTSNAGVFTEA